MKGNTLQTMGYEIQDIPVMPRPMAWYRHKDGRVVQLPADPYCLQYYQNKGLVLVPEGSAKSAEDKPFHPKRGRPKKAKQTLKNL